MMAHEDQKNPFLQLLLRKLHPQRDLLIRQQNDLEDLDGDQVDGQPILLFRSHQGRCGSCSTTWTTNRVWTKPNNKCPVCRISLHTPTKSVLGSTPYQGLMRCYGWYLCVSCGRGWSSAFSWANCGQGCQGCRGRVYPHRQDALRWFGRGGAEVLGHDRSLCEMCLKLKGQQGLKGQLGGDCTTKRRFDPTTLPTPYQQTQNQNQNNNMSTNTNSKSRPRRARPRRRAPPHTNKIEDQFQLELKEEMTKTKNEKEKEVSSSDVCEAVAAILARMALSTTTIKQKNPYP